MKASAGGREIELYGHHLALPFYLLASEFACRYFVMVFASHVCSFVYYYSYHFIYSEAEPNSTVANRVSVLNYKSSKFEMF